MEKRDCPETRLALENIKKSFDRTEVLHDITLTLEYSHFVSILGVSGSGKSTLLNIIAGLEKPDSGSVCVNGKIGYMMQKDLLLPWKRIIDNVSLPLQIGGMPKKQAREAAAGHFGMFGIEGCEMRFPYELSGGMKQRAALLRTYLISGEIMLLDEPFAAVDAITREKLHDWLMKVYRELNLSVLLITHDIDEALKLSDKIYVLSDKPARVLEAITPGDVAGERKAELKQHIMELLEP